MRQIIFVILSLFFLSSCNESGLNDINEESCKKKLDVVYGFEIIGSACIVNDSITEVWIKPEYDRIICTELLMNTDVVEESLLATQCLNSKPNKVYRIKKVATLDLDLYFEKSGFKDKIDSLKALENYDSLKLQGDKLLDSLIKSGEFY